MSVTVYDEAVKAKIQNLFQNTEYQSRELVFKTLTDRYGEVKFPMISIFRPDGWTISSNNTWIENREFLNDLRQVYVDLSYQIDIYANTREDLEDITAELVLYLLRNPGISVVYKSVDKTEELQVRTNLVYVSGPDRTSELEDTTVGRVYRYTLVYMLSDAALYAFADTSGGGGGGGSGSGGDYVPKITEVIVEIRASKQPEVIDILADDNGGKYGKNKH